MNKKYKLIKRISEPIQYFLLRRKRLRCILLRLAPVDASSRSSSANSVDIKKGRIGTTFEESQYTQNIRQKAIIQLYMTIISIIITIFNEMLVKISFNPHCLESIIFDTAKAIQFFRFPGNLKNNMLFFFITS